MSFITRQIAVLSTEQNNDSSAAWNIMWLFSQQESLDRINTFFLSFFIISADTHDSLQEVFLAQKFISS